MSDTEDSHRTTIVVHSVGEILAHARRGDVAGLSADLHAVVTRVHHTGGVSFLGVTDGTGVIQVVLQRSSIGDDDWGAVKRLAEGNRLRVSGYVDNTARGTLSVFSKDVPTILSLPIMTSDAPGPTIRSIGQQVYLARLRNRATEFLLSHNFIEIEPRLISTAWNSTGLNPLRVDYPGFGAPLFLAPSPHPQLLHASITVGAPRLFCHSKCLVGEYRGTNDSTESSILCCTALSFSRAEAVHLSVDLTRFVFDDEKTMPEQHLALHEGWATQEADWPSGASEAPSPSFTTTLFRPFSVNDEYLGPRRVELFSIRSPSGVIVCDGSVESLGSEISVAAITIHKERMVRLIQDVPMRRLLRLQFDPR